LSRDEAVADEPTASQTLAGPDGRNFRVDSYITTVQPTNGGYAKLVVIVVAT
jgi:hypothetical protein